MKILIKRGENVTGISSRVIKVGDIVDADLVSGFRVGYRTSHGYIVDPEWCEVVNNLSDLFNNYAKAIEKVTESIE